MDKPFPRCYIRKSFYWSGISWFRFRPWSWLFAPSARWRYTSRYIHDRKYL